MQERTSKIKNLTLDESIRLFAVIKDKRDKAIFLTAYDNALRASEIGLQQKTDLDFKQFRVMIHRLKGSRSGQYPMRAHESRTIKAHFPSGRISPLM